MSLIDVAESRSLGAGHVIHVVQEAGTLAGFSTLLYVNL